MYNIGSWKTNPEIFEYAPEKMGFAPINCLVIEDSFTGIGSAKRANLTYVNIQISETVKYLKKQEH